ncbi:Dienelactone hydrolase [Promicromonospora umidemergens]|uniref:Dienelactone hydrolase family protein n=1 Tax=Promicromonospora umidemergens TaxID=629679 RepID=A0ABP8XZJ6_9MICO|nr:alpha/beta hydrolase [Promicromonospora umidemergens]MCP2284168.1 Dienelactone hydrolase [Promicromonospora umidemergens]
MDAEARAVRLPADGGAVDGDLVVPAVVRGAVVFAHGSGSSRHSSRNQYVAAGLHRAGFATLLMDLLTPHEEQVDLITRQWRFDISLLSARLVAAVDHLGTMEETARFPIATFGASTGAAAAVRAAAARPQQIHAVISRGGRPDLAGDDLSRVRAPTLLLVGGEDHVVIELNEQAAAQLAADHELRIVPRATHLFEEPGALDEVITASVEWLERWMPQ